jgi:hypothetical protein
MTKHAARAHLAAALLGTTQAPARTPPSPLFASLVPCDGWVVRGLSLTLLVLPAPSVLLRRRSRASVPEIKQQDQAGVGGVGGA